MDKRTFLKSVFLGGTGLFLSASVSKIKASRVKKTWDGIFVQPELEYSYSSLEPYMKSSTLKAHYEVYHKEYTRKLNDAVKQAGIKGITAYEILTRASQYPATLVETSGGYLNHKFLWKTLQPARNQQPSSEFKSVLSANFGSPEEFQKQFLETAVSHNENGWNWLVFRKNSLEIVFTENHGSPLTDTFPKQGIPLLCLDLWDHAYPDAGVDGKTAYIKSCWNLINWKFVSRRYHFASRNSRRSGLAV